MDFEVRHIDGTTVKLISSEHKCAITSATQTRKLCGNDTVTINLQSATYIEFQVGDKITIFGTTYTLNQLPTVKKESERSYTYTLVFEGLQYTLIDRVFLMPDNTQGDNLMFDLAGMLDVLDDNINRGNSGKQYEFVLDESLEETEYKNLSLTGKNCLQVLQQLCQEWDTEFVFAEEPTRIAIYIGVAGSTFPTTFKYGRGGGVYELNREKGASDICTRLFVYGGTQNLTYYRHNRLCLPLKEKNQSYVEDATAQAVYGIKEQVKNFDDIYPNRIGTITSLSGCDYNEFIDSAMADAQYGFDLNEKWANNADDCEEWLALKGLEDTPENEAIYYNDVAGTATKYLMAGATAKIHFNTGALAGYECDLHSYTHSSQKFVLKPIVDENGYDFPSKTNAAFKLAVGDEYVILDINLPTAYKTQAESKLATEAASYFDTVCRPQPKYTLTIEPIALKHLVGPSTADTEIFKVGDLINISDPTGGVDSATIRIDQFVRNLLDPFDYKLTLTDEITYSQQVRTLIEVDAIKRVVEESKIYDVNRIRRGWKDAEELYNQMFDTEGHYYSEKIAPLSIDTQMLKVGARSQQLVLQNVLFQPNYNANPANLQISAGSLVHYTIAEPDIKTWTMSALSASNVPSTAQYVYAKCAKNGTTGTWLVTDQAIIFDSDPSYYHFLVGSLSSVDSVSNTRNFAATYGFTTINGRNITTGVIKSSDGSSVVIDLDAGIIKGNITFEAGTTSYNALQSIIGNNTTVQVAVTTAESASATATAASNKVDNLQVGGRNYIIINDAWEQGSCVIVEGKTWEQCKTTNTKRIRTKTTIAIEKNTKYTISIKGGYKYELDKFSNGLATGDVGWETDTYTFDSGNNDSVAFLVSFAVDADITPAEIENVKFKLEQGTVATDWSPAPEDTEAALTVLQTDLQNQIDQKIETWAQNSDPSSSWTTTDAKDKHVGDLWQYTGATSGSLIHNDTYKYTKNGSTYSWVSFSAAAELFDEVDGKTTIYYGSPSGTYAGVQTGDFLVDSDTNICYKWSGSAWVKVQDVQVGGRNLLPCINYWENGSCTSGTGQTWEQIKTTTNTRIRTINTQSVETNTDYTISIGDGYSFELETFLNGGWVSNNGGWKTGKITFNTGTNNSVAFLVRKTDNSTILPSEIVNAKIKFEKGNRATDWTPAPEDVDAEIDEQTRKNLQATCSTAAGTANKDITCSDWKDSFFKTGTHITIEFTNANTADYPYLIINGTTCFLEYAGGLSGKSGTTYIGSPKWVKGQQIAFTYDGEKTNSTPSGDETRHTFKVEDEAAFKATLILAKSIEGTTDIEGGLVLTNTIMLRDENNAFTAGLSGLKENDIAFWAGGTLQNAMADTAKVWIKHGGMARFGAVYIDGRNTGDMTMRDSSGNTRLKIKNSALQLTTANGEVAYNSGNQSNNGTYATGSSLSSTSITGTESNKQSTDIFTLGNLNHTGTFEFEVAIRIESLAINVQPAAAGGDYLVELEFYNGTAWESVGRFSVDADVVANNVLATSSNPLVYSKTYQGTPDGYGYSKIGLRARYWTTRQSAPGTSPAGYLTFSGVKWCYYKDNTKASMQIANNGMAYYLNATNHLIVQPNSGDTALTTTIKGNTNMPGVLWAGEISSSGVPQKKWANSNVSLVAASSSPHPAAGDYKFTLSGVSSAPIAIANVIGSGSNGWSAKIDTNTNNTIRVRIYNDNTAADSAFNLLIIGSN